MIQKLSHTPIWVLDQQRAKDFYVNILGFELKTDAPISPDFRWITVSPPGQPDLEINLMPIGPTFGEDLESAQKLRDLVSAGKMGAGVFSTPDCRKTYEELKAKGVQFKKEPTEEFYGIEAIMVDDSGNWFSMSQPK